MDKLLTAGFGDESLACSPDLVAQYLSIADDAPDAFAALPQTTQAERHAERIWQALFVERSLLSEACVGVVSTLEALGLTESLERRSLSEIRKWSASHGH